MKNLPLLAFLSVFRLALSAQSCDPALYYFDNAVNGESVHLELAPNGGYLIVGTTQILGAGGKDIYVIRVDALGNEIWHRTLGGNKSDQGKAVIATADGNYIILGTSNYGVFLAKMDDNGNTIWSKTYNEPNGQLSAEDVLEEPSGNLIVAAGGFLSNAKSMALLKFDPGGNLLMKKYYRPYIAVWGNNLPPGNGHAEALSVARTADGNYLFAGSAQYSLNVLSGSNLVILKTDTGFNPIWQTNYSGGQYSCYDGNAGIGIIPYPDGSIYIANRKAGVCYDGGPIMTVLYKLDAQGNEIWYKNLWSGVAADIRPTSDGQLALISQYSNLMKADTAGVLQWHSWAGYSFSVYGNHCLRQTPDGGFAYVGSTTQGSSTKFVLAKTDANGNSCQNQISGKVYYDQNGNCKPDTGEAVLPNVMLSYNNGSNYDLTNPAGRYLFIAGTGSSTVQVIPPNDFWSLTCPPGGVQQLNLPAPYQKPDSIHFGLTPKDACPVLSLQSNLSSQRICRDGKYQLELCNYGSTAAGSIQVAVQWPDQMHFLSANFPYTQNGKVYTFDAGSLDIGACKTLVVADSMRCDAILGDQICIDANIQALPGCSSYSYKTGNSLCRILSNSYDPNDKAGFPDNRNDCFFTGKNQAKTVDYQIHFQNTGNDTAYQVVVIDTLDRNKLDMASFRPGPSSHPYEVQIRNDNVLVWLFKGINLPDSSTNRYGSQGYLNFNIGLKKQLKGGERVLNGASIYFDTNVPVQTPVNELITCVFLDAETPRPGNAPDWTIYPNPASGSIRVDGTNLDPEIQLILSDFQGRVFKTCSLTRGGMEISLSGIPPGMYSVYLSGREQRICRKLVIRD